LFLWALAALCGLPAVVAWAQSNFFAGADLALGRQLMAEHKCEVCHVRHVGGDGTDVYNPAGRLKTPGLLRGMVEACNTQLNLGLFPEEVNAVAAVLNHDHYRFK
jgi:hypothetical protein